MFKVRIKLVYMTIAMLMLYLVETSMGWEEIEENEKSQQWFIIYTTWWINQSQMFIEFSE
jgi:hypothetical protein